MRQIIVRPFYINGKPWLHRTPVDLLAWREIKYERVKIVIVYCVEIAYQRISTVAI